MDHPANEDTAELTFLKRDPLYDKEKPFLFLTNVPEKHTDRRQTNIINESVVVPITDIRGKEDHWTLDDQGFTFRQNQLEFTEFENEDLIERYYVPSARKILLQEVDDADDAFVFDWRVRRSDYVPREIDLSSKIEWLPPASTVHIDQSPLRVLQILESAKVGRNIDKEKLELYMKGRIRIVNVWRPINGPVQDMPLALCDGSTLQPSDLYPHDVIRSYGHRIREAMAVAHSDTQKWYYYSRQDPNEVLLLKCFDSKEDVPAMWSPHTAFKHNRTPEEAPPRMSIEVRALIFTLPREGIMD